MDIVWICMDLDGYLDGYLGGFLLSFPLCFSLTFREDEVVIVVAAAAVGAGVDEDPVFLRGRPMSACGNIFF